MATPFTSSNTLIVPIDVDALAVNSSFKNKPLRRWRMNYFKLLRHNDPEPLPFYGEIAEGYFNKPENHGVYLHWHMPKGLCKGSFNKTTSETQFPALPNRWLVTRVYEKGGTTETSHWVIYSDAVDQPKNQQAGDRGSTFAYVDKHNKKQVGKLGLTQATFDEMEPILKEEQSTFKKLQFKYPTELNAIGSGDVNFLAYQPLVNDVFSFHDPLTSEMIKDASGKLHYMVAGWYSDSSEEALNVESKTVKQRLEELEWVVGNDQKSADVEGLKRSLFYGRTYNLTITSAEYHKNSPSPQVILGNNSTDALSAYVQHGLKQNVNKGALQFFNAFLHDELPLLDQAGGDILLQQKIRKSWFKTRSGGVYWSIESEEVAATAPELPAQNEKQPTESQLEKLAELNAEQAKREAGELILKQYQQVLYDAWWELVAKKESLSSEEGKKIDQQIESLKDKRSGSAKEIVRLQNTLLRATQKVNGKLAELKKELGKGFILEKHHKVDYFKTLDPTIMITGLAEPTSVQDGGSSQCRRFSELKSNPVNFPSFPKKPLLKLLCQDFWQDKARAHLQWKQPWKPMFVEWEVEWFDLPFALEKKRYWNYNGVDYDLKMTTEIIQKSGFQRKNGHRITGRSFISPDANRLLKSRLEDFKKSSSNMEKGKADSVNQFVNSLLETSFLSHRLENFNNKLMMRASQMSPLPDDDELIELIGDQTHNQPDNNASTPPSFQGLRQGQFKINRLQVYDSFGQCEVLVGGRAERASDRHFPIKSDHLTPGKDEKGELITIYPYGRERFVELKPRIMEYTRLSADFMGADNKEIGKSIALHPNVNPVHAWLIHNHLDQSLIFFDNKGKFLLEMRITDGTLYRSKAPSEITDTVLKGFCEAIPESPDGFMKFLNIIDETLWTIDATAPLQERHLAVWMGKPLALVNARLQFNSFNPPLQKQVQAVPQEEQRSLQLKHARKSYDAFEYLFKLGSQGIRQDGLIGYFQKGVFCTVHPVGISSASSYIKPARNEALYTAFSSPLDLALLVDPRAGVHAQSGVLPTTVTKIPEHFVNRALEEIEVFFRFHTLLTRVQTSTEQEGEESITLPLPALSKGKWEWREKTEDGTRAYNIQGTNLNESDTYHSALVRDGRLILSDALKPDHNQD